MKENYREGICNFRERICNYREGICNYREGICIECNNSRVTPRENYRAENLDFHAGPVGVSSRYHDISITLGKLSPWKPVFACPIAEGLEISTECSYQLRKESLNGMSRFSLNISESESDMF